MGMFSRGRNEWSSRSYPFQGLSLFIHPCLSCMSSGANGLELTHHLALGFRFRLFLPLGISFIGCSNFSTNFFHGMEQKYSCFYSLPQVIWQKSRPFVAPPLLGSSRKKGSAHHSGADNVIERLYGTYLELSSQGTLDYRKESGFLTGSSTHF